jgi:D-alanine-D-alanine ligase
VKVLLLFDLFRRTTPAETFETPDALRAEDKKTEADLFEVLVRLGHEPGAAGVYDEIRPLFDRIESFKPDVVLNTCESFLSNRAHEPNIPALLELLGVRYTGAGPDALMLCKDKALAKKLLTFHSVRVADFVVSPRERPLRALKKLAFPVFVKPVNEESSDGISKASFAKTEAEAVERARFVHEQFGCDALIEEYVDGRELTVGVLGNARLTILPPQELFFGEPKEDGQPEDPAAPRFLTAKAKWDDKYRKKWGIRNGPAAPLPNGTGDKLAKIARRVYRILHIRGLGRIDARLAPSGEIVVMEANPNPSLGKGDDFALAAARSGIEYDDLIAQVLANAVRSG